MIVEFDASSIDPLEGHPSRTVLRGVNGARMGVSLVAGEEYGKEETHEDQEGLFFVEGTGYAMFDGVEYPVGPNTYVLMPAHTRHCFKKAPGGAVIKLLWFHSAV